MKSLIPLLCLAASISAYAASYYVDPAKGDDTNNGTSAATAWKTFAKLEVLTLGPGDKVTVAPGVHTATLHPKARGSKEAPAIIEFLPGTHEFAPEKAIRRPLFVTNACDAPREPKPFGILVEDCAHLRLRGAGVEGDRKTLLLMGGRMIEAENLRSEDIAYKGLVFDLKRPTVSEFRVLETTADGGVIRVAEGSTFEIRDGKLRWTGDRGSGRQLCQIADPEKGTCQWYDGDVLRDAAATDLGDGKVRLAYAKGNGGLVAGRQYQFRLVRRDSVGIHNDRCKAVAFEDCDVYALTNLGLISQFTDGLTLRRVRVASPKGTFRTCPAWADIFQFSNCRGAILIEDCVESGMQDDAVNCHGTHLRVVGKPVENRLTLRYMHPQTYGFAPYASGDTIAVIDHRTLRELPDNPRRKVVACAQTDKDGREWTVTLDGAAPAYAKDDVTDNVTWHPDLTIRGCTVTMDPVRGYLLTTRGKVLIENNTIRSHGAGILLEDDANGWFESACVRDMTIRDNRFLGCGIEINPQTKADGGPVHENIRIENNIFDGGEISAKGVKNLVVTGNRTPQGGKVPAHIAKSCADVTTD